MIMVQVQNEIYGFRYYDQYGNHQTVSLRRDDQGGLARVNDDGSEEALLELKGISVSDAPIPCENYNNLKNSGAGSILGWNTIFHESFDVMKEYYAGRTSCEDVSEYIRSLCHFSTSSKSQITESLSVIYEHMSRANTRNAVNQNMKEAEKLFSDTGSPYSFLQAFAAFPYSAGIWHVSARACVCFGCMLACKEHAVSGCSFAVRERFVSVRFLACEKANDT